MSLKKVDSYKISFAGSSYFEVAGIVFGEVRANLND